MTAQHEYKVKFKAVAMGEFLGMEFPLMTAEGIEFYKADSAKEAIALCEAEFEANRKKKLVSRDEVKFSVTDVEKM